MEASKTLKVICSIFIYLCSIFWLVFAVYIMNGLGSQYYLTGGLVIIGSLLLMPPVTNWVSNIFDNKVKGYQVVLFGSLVIYGAMYNSSKYEYEHEYEHELIIIDSDDMGMIEILPNE